MSNPPKQKGTKFETKVVKYFVDKGFHSRRTPASHPYDVVVDPDVVPAYLPSIRALVTEPDGAQETLVVMTLEEFADLLGGTGYGAFIECKKWRAFPHHTLWRKEMSWPEVEA